MYDKEESLKLQMLEIKLNNAKELEENAFNFYAKKSNERKEIETKIQEIKSKYKAYYVAEDYYWDNYNYCEIVDWYTMIGYTTREKAYEMFSDSHTRIIKCDTKEIYDLYAKLSKLYKLKDTEVDDEWLDIIENKIGKTENEIADLKMQFENSNH